MNAKIHKELEKHGIHKDLFLARQCTLHRIRQMRTIEPNDFILSGIVEWSALTGTEKLIVLVQMNVLDLQLAADLLLAARPLTPAMAMAHYNLLELMWGIEIVQSV
jgi:hypothetical protein